MPTITTQDGCSLYYKTWGQGRPVVLIHGWPLSSDSWDDTAMALADAGYRTIAYDRRGFGRSEQTWSGYDYNRLSEDLSDLIEDLQLRDVSLVGFSMGGGEIARYLTKHSAKRVTSVALISTVLPLMLQTSGNTSGVPSAVFETMKRGINKDRPEFLSGFFKEFYNWGLMSGPVSSEMLDWSKSIAMQAGLKASLDCIDAFSQTDFRPDLKSFTVPTLIIHGSSDQTVPIDLTSRCTAKEIKHASFIEYAGAPHGLFATHKNRLNKDLISFLGEHRATDVQRATEGLLHF